MRLRTSLLPEMIGSFSYVDSVAIQLPKLLEKTKFRKLRLAVFGTQGSRKRRIVLRKHYLPERAGAGWFFVMYIHQPTKESLMVLDDFKYPLAHVAVALDLTTKCYSDNEKLRRFLDHRLQKNGRPVRSLTWIDDSTAHFGQSNSRRRTVLVSYSDRHSKVHESPCVHLELRIYGASSLTSRGLRKGKGVIDLNHREFWDSQLRLQKPPSRSKLMKARTRLMRRRGDGGSERLSTIDKTVDVILRASSSFYVDSYRKSEPDLVGSDLLFLLRENTNIVGKNPGRLFTPESHQWMLPTPGNALWDSAVSKVGRFAERDSGDVEPRLEGKLTTAHRTSGSKHVAPRTLGTANMNDDECLSELLQLKLGKQSACPTCGVSPARMYKVTRRKSFICKDCSTHIYPCVGTPFERSTTPLSKWFTAISLIANEGASGAKLHQQLGVNPKSATRMRKTLLAWVQLESFWKGDRELLASDT